MAECVVIRSSGHDRYTLVTRPLPSKRARCWKCFSKPQMERYAPVRMDPVELRRNRAADAAAHHPNDFDSVGASGKAYRAMPW